MAIKQRCSLECHTNCDTGHLFIMVTCISERGPVTLTTVAERLSRGCDSNMQGERSY